MMIMMMMMAVSRRLDVNGLPGSSPVAIDTATVMLAARPHTIKHIWKDV